MKIEWIDVEFAWPPNGAFILIKGYMSNSMRGRETDFISIGKIGTFDDVEDFKMISTRARKCKSTDKVIHIGQVFEATEWDRRRITHWLPVSKLIEPIDV